MICLEFEFLRRTKFRSNMFFWLVKTQLDSGVIELLQIYISFVYELAVGVFKAVEYKMFEVLT